MLRRITELVDRDVEANNKPISLIGAVIPFVPLMLFVDGAPIDSYPLMGGAALATSVCWVLFVTWRMLRHTRAKLEGYGYTIGSSRFWRLIIVTGLLIAIITAMITWFRIF